jgi:hypothetical protein
MNFNIFFRFLFGVVMVPAASASQPFSLGPEYLSSTYLEMLPNVAGPHLGQMNRCIKNWAAIPMERAAAFTQPIVWPANNGGPTIFLEIGSSGFPKYSYIHIIGNKLRSNLLQSGLALGKVSVESVNAIYAQAFNEIQQGDWLKVEDGDCYFLTVDNGKKRQLILSFGAERLLPNDSIIKKIINLPYQN